MRQQGIGWGKYALATIVVIVGLAAVDAIAPRATLGAVALVLLSVAIAHPTFSGELQRMLRLR